MYMREMKKNINNNNNNNLIINYNFEVQNNLFVG